MNQTRSQSYCLMGTLMCVEPSGCKNCGFHKAEALRRKSIPLTLNSRGKYRKYITNGNTYKG